MRFLMPQYWLFLNLREICVLLTRFADICGGKKLPDYLVNEWRRILVIVCDMCLYFCFQ